MHLFNYGQLKLRQIKLINRYSTSQTSYNKHKVKVIQQQAEVAKGVPGKAVCGSYSTAALRHIVLLPE